MRKLLCLLAVTVLVSEAMPSFAESVLKRAKRDGIAHVPQNDPDMEAAFAQARASLDVFLGLARSPRPTITSMAVKVSLNEGDQYEFFWISQFTERGGWITGRIDNTPRLVKHVRLGDEITFANEDVVDWLYRENGKMIGNFTGCVLLKREPRSEAEKFKRHFGLSCEKQP
jgi:uncharacterized protein YegJ (DUF2314 family)